MWAYKNGGYHDNSTFYQCPITISNTSSANNSTYVVPDSVAKLAASSIAIEADGQLTILDRFGHHSRFIHLGKSHPIPCSDFTL